MHVTSGAMLRLRFWNDSVPEQPPKLYPTLIAVTRSSSVIVKVMAVP
jgi:hypothetical protein